MRATYAAKTNAPPPSKTAARANARAPGSVESAISQLPSLGRRRRSPRPKRPRPPCLYPLGRRCAFSCPEAAGGGDVDEGQRGELKANLTNGMGELICRLYPTDGEGVPLEALKAMSEGVVAEVAKTRMLLLPLATNVAGARASHCLAAAR
jgi:hypothetical protein